MKLIRPNTFDETCAEQLAARRYNPAQKFRFKRAEGTLKAGTSDHLTFWADGNHRVLVLTVNYRMGYIGLDEYELNSTGKIWELVNEAFIQNTSELPEDFFDWGYVQMRNHMLDYLCV